jgi:hypothetical protein
LNNNRVWLIRDFILAVLITFLVASVSHSQFVLWELAKVGAEINFTTRVSASLQDIIGFLPSYAAVIAVGLLIGFSISARIKSKFNSAFLGWYPIAGGLSLLTIHAAMYPILEITLIAGARSSAGLVMQIIAGLIGGWLFYRLRKRALKENI